MKPQIRKEMGFAITPNKLVNSDKLSLKAKGLYTYLSSKPDNWEFANNRIAAEIKEGVSTVKATLRELEKYGWLERKPYQNEQGHWKRNYILKFNNSEPKESLSADTPLQENPGVENQPQEEKIPGVKNPTQENPTQENQPINKEINNKEINNKKRERSARADFSKSKELSGADKTKKNRENGQQAFDYIKECKPKEFERKFKNKYAGKIRDKQEFVDRFNNKMIIEGLRFDADKLLARLCNYAGSWVSNQSKYDLQYQSEKNSSSKIPMA